MTIKRNVIRRTQIERRVFSYSYYIPERRSGEDRRERHASGYQADHGMASFSQLLAEKNAA